MGKSLLSNFKFLMNYNWGADTIKNNSKLQSMELAKAQELLDTISAGFTQEFGVEGKFKMAPDRQGNRFGYIIDAADQRTRVVLKRHPKWLHSFIERARI